MSTIGINLALILFSYPFLPGGSTLSNNAIASLCIPSIIWLYTSIVKATELCPRASEITLGLAPLHFLETHGHSKLLVLISRVRVQHQAPLLGNYPQRLCSLQD